MCRLLIVGCLLAVALSSEQTEEDPITALLKKNEFNGTVQFDSPDSNSTSNSSLVAYSNETLKPEHIIHGTLGLNYNLENGTPFIRCMHRNRTTPVSKNGNCFAEPGRHWERLACMIVFKYDSNTTTIYENKENPYAMIHIDSQGCWTNQHESLMTCTKSGKCYHAGEVRNQQQYFCCCMENECNDRVIVDLEWEVKHLEELRIEAERLERIKREERNALILRIVISVAAILFIAAGAVLFVFLYRRYFRKDLKRNQGSVVAPESANLLKDGEGSLDGMKLEVDYHTGCQAIGKGKYGEVLKGTWKGMVVAVKCIENNANSFTNELMIYREKCIRQYEKNNILRLLDCEQSSNGSGKLMTEYHELGNLHAFLTNNIIERQQDTVNIIVNLLDALAYLHEERGYTHGDPKPAILHRDIKSHNVLLRRDDRGRLMGVLMDFGLSMKCSQGIIADNQGSSQMYKVVGTQRYMAPELLIGATEFSTSSFRAVDVYAMALVLWEIVSRSKVSYDDEVPAYEDPLESYLRKEQAWSGQIRLSTFRQVVVTQKKRPAFREKHISDPVFSSIKNSIEEMWEHEAEARITAACAHKRMEALLEEPSIGYHSDENQQRTPAEIDIEAQDEDSKSSTLVEVINEEEDESVKAQNAALLLKSTAPEYGADAIEMSIR